MKLVFIIICFAFVSYSQAQSSLLVKLELVRIYNDNDSVDLDLKSQNQIRLFVSLHETSYKKQRTKYLLSIDEVIIDNNEKNNPRNKWDFTIYNIDSQLKVRWKYSKYPSMLGEVSEYLNYLWLNLEGSISNWLIENDLLVVTLENGLELSFTISSVSP